MEAVCINSKTMIKILVDIGMTISLLFLMTYELIGQATHEWIGVIIFILFIVHHILNHKWSKHLLKGKYTLYRMIQTVLVFGVLATMIGAMVSGIILSRHVFSFLPVNGRRSLARSIHMLSAYWGLVLMSLHLGFHWSMMMGMARKLVKKQSSLRTWMLRMIALLIAGFGIWAFIKRQIGSYMLLRNQFVFFDFDEPLVLFLADYLAVMGLFVVVGHYLSEGLKRTMKK
ncbi:MAG: DUF4405 domain-containing protein [Coprococcus sp.]